MRWLVRSVAIALSFLLLSAPPILQRWIGGDTRAYVVTTLVLVLIGAWLVVSWRAHEPEATLEGRRSPVWPAVVAVAAAALVLVICRGWLRVILAVPIDPFRADMLVVIREGLRHVRLGLNPYATYHIPWAATLPYGPLFWGSYGVPFSLQIDLRFMTVAGQLFAPISCAVAAAAFAWRGRLAASAGSLLMLSAIGFSPDLLQFTATAHTPVYWPLLVVFAWLVTREQWRAAGLVLGLLIATRSTMVAMAPVLLMAVWFRDRPALVQTAIALLLAAVLPFLPFAIIDMKSLVYALYGSYEKLKEVVWPEPTVPHTIGVTGVLLSHHWQRSVEAVQLIVLALTYVACGVALRRGRAPVAAMGLALLAFSLTTLWPVVYIYFDVFVLLAAGVVAHSLSAPRSTMWLAGAAAAMLVAGIAIVAAMIWFMLPARVSVGAIEWRDAPQMASAVCVRRSNSGALIDVELGPGAAGTRAMTLQLNGVMVGEIGRAIPGDHWVVAAPRSAWQIGANLLRFDGASPSAIARVGVR